MRCQSCSSGKKLLTVLGWWAMAKLFHKEEFFICLGLQISFQVTNFKGHSCSLRTRHGGPRKPLIPFPQRLKTPHHHHHKRGPECFKGHFPTYIFSHIAGKWMSIFESAALWNCVHLVNQTLGSVVLVTIRDPITKKWSLLKGLNAQHFLLIGIISMINWLTHKEMRQVI